MRIIGGEWRGRKLAGLGDGDEAAHLRPSSDRFRETVFSILNSEKYKFAPKDMRVLDLFAGTGALSFEALSRGAKAAVMVDNGSKSKALILQNAKELRAMERVELRRCDATALGKNQEAPFDLVFLDPPYGQSLGEKALQSAGEGGWLQQDSVIIWEDALAPVLPNFLDKVDQRKIGRAILTIAKHR